MSNYKFDSIVSRSEADALKEMIFKRARERAEALAEDINTSYTSSVKNELMDIARDSFVSSKNPFAVKEEKKPEEPENKEIGFPQRKIEEIKSQINYRTKDIAGKEVDSAMRDAGVDFRKKQSFIGALDFLNSQATIALINKRGKSFEALA